MNILSPFDSNLPDWFDRAQYDESEPNKYSYRHLVTTYNMDRIIDPNGDKMFNVNAVLDAQRLYEKLLKCIDYDNLSGAEVTRIYRPALI